jgi:ParB family chromosome partitioning protein
MERRLGRGLGSLLGQSNPIDDQNNTLELPLENLRPNPRQPRKAFDQGTLQELADSLRLHGILQPVVVRRTIAGYELISGERRWRAARIAGLSTIPAVVRPGVSDEEMLELALVENVQRQDLDAVERAHGFRAMMDALRITQEEVAKKVGLQRATVANHLRLLDLPPQIQEAVSKGLLSMGHARAILGLQTPGDQLNAMERAVREGLSVRQVEAFAREGSPRSKPGVKSSKSLIPHQPWIVDLERQIRECLGTKVSIHNKRGFRGQIAIDYYDRSGLERLCKILAPGQRLD